MFTGYRKIELQRHALSMTSGRIPARLASMAVAKPVGPAPMQIMSYAPMRISVCREFLGIANYCNATALEAAQGFPQVPAGTIRVLSISPASRPLVSFSKQTLGLSHT